MTQVASRFRPYGTTIFAEMTALANQHSAVNLSQVGKWKIRVKLTFH